MKLRSTRTILALWALLLFLLSSPLFALESYTITETQMASLSQNLATLKGLTLKLRQNLDSYKQELQTTAMELKQSEAKLELAESESNVFILKLSNQQKLLTEQSKSLQTAKKSLKRLRRKNKAKNILFMLLLGAAVAYR